MSIIRVKKDRNNPYLIMNKTGLNDSRLSLRAKGLLCYLLSKPDNWYINTREIVSNSSNGIRSVWSTINESPDLIKTTTSPHCQNASVDNASVDNDTLLINNKELNNKTLLTTLYNKSNNVNVAQDDPCQKESKEYTVNLLNELYIKNHKILFDSFDDSDIFYYADWMLTFKSKIKNPTGFLIAALRGRWLDVNKFYNLPEDFGKDSD